ncbi:hypothetical protein [Actinosynnema sp. NPDC020468]|uniref:hypothetical protein n=1 Tax=Actinosynnema sp. NPDC020468 TaxID=3154488 RepID=UPI0033C836EC
MNNTGQKSSPELALMISEVRSLVARDDYEKAVQIATQLWHDLSTNADVVDVNKVDALCRDLAENNRLFSRMERLCVIAVEYLTSRMAFRRAELWALRRVEICRAKELHRQSLATKRAMERALTDLAAVFAARCRWNRIIDCLDMYLRTQISHKDAHGIAFAMREHGATRLRANRIIDATTYLLRSLAQYEAFIKASNATGSVEESSRLGKARCRVLLARCHQAQGRHRAARAQLRAAIGEVDDDDLADDLQRLYLHALVDSSLPVSNYFPLAEFGVNRWPPTSADCHGVPREEPNEEEVI